jgi:hypothetical protein
MRGQLLKQTFDTEQVWRCGYRDLNSVYCYQDYHICHNGQKFEVLVIFG